MACEPREEQMALLVYQKFLGRPLEVVMDIQDQNGCVYEYGHGVTVAVIFEIPKKLKVKENLFYHQLKEWKERQQVYLMMTYSTLELQMKLMTQ